MDELKRASCQPGRSNAWFRKFDSVSGPAALLSHEHL